MPSPASPDARTRFETLGFLPARAVLSPRECRAARRRLRHGARTPPADWPKGQAVTSRAFFDLATLPAILDGVSEILGPDVALWGAMLAVQPPGAAHPWHSDSECVAAGPSVGVWLGLANVRLGSGLTLVSRSHRLAPIQEVAAKHGVCRDALDARQLEGWAREHDPRCEIVEPELAEGDALLFDGRLWHASLNRNRFATRTALLLQYGPPSAEVPIPEPDRLGWPLRHLTAPRPASIMVRGTDTHGTARIVAAPSVEGGVPEPAIGSRIQSLGLPLEENAATGWNPQLVFRGSTPNVARLVCHLSTLSPGCEPHPVHAHEDEELLVMLAGEADLVIESGGRERLHRVEAGRFAFYPARHRHTLRNPADAPATYLIFKWWSPGAAPASRLEAGVYPGRWDEAPSPDGDAGGPFRTRGLFAEATGYLRTLGCHLSRVEPGGGYAPHADAHDVALVPVAGRFETGGREVGPGSVVFFAGGERHGLRNPGDEPAEYLVFELHGRGRLAPRVGTLVRLQHRFGAWPEMPERLARGLWRRARHAASTLGGRGPRP